MLQNTHKVNRQVQRSKSWMLDALLLLMDEMPYDKITISDITEKAGVARQTFYRNYAGKDDIALQYLDSIFNNNFLKMKNVRDEKGRNVLAITLSFRGFIEHKEKLAKLQRDDTERLILAYTQKWEDYVIDFGKNKVSRAERLLFRYTIKFHVGGSLRMILDWMKHDMPMPGEQMSSLLQKFIDAAETGAGGLPNLTIRIQNN
ncbi:MAG: TetR/AcrR family transcriptional regulator [Spirochaetaceae bacterium]|nr:TetR/AcrR family transcriptional regulator [Spirochaetaceae bacterium]